MKRCLTCNAQYKSSIRNCTHCGFGPALVDDFDAYAPELSHCGYGFKASYFSELASLEWANFWFRSRNQLIIGMLKKYCRNFGSLLEVGCGTGYVLSGVAEAFPEATLNGSEIFTAGLDFAVTRLPKVNFMQMDARNIPFVDEFEVIGVFDVLEHIKEDELVLSQIHTALKSQGYLLITVPQHQWLWSAVDEYACHVRRYNNADLVRKIKTAGFEIVRTTSFVTTLLPAMMVSRFFQNNKSAGTLDATAELKINPVLNFIFYMALRFELMIIKSGINFPIGGSRLVVAQKIMTENDL